MNDDKDLLDFFDALGTGMDEKQTARRRRSESAAPTASKAEDTATGQLVQYAEYGAGFLPTARTFKKLPTGVYRPMSTQSGIIALPINLYTDSILRLPDSKSDTIVKEIEQFWNTPKADFDEFGLSDKLGIQMWGPPGSGKTMTIAIVIEEMLKRGGIVVLVDHPGLGGPLLSSFRSIEPDRKVVVVLEDIDTIIEQHGESQLLSFLDGEAQINGVVNIATTNYPEKLDSRLFNRPGRFDLVMKVDMPSAEARRFYLESKTKQKASDWLIKETDGMSVAHLREYIRSVFIFKRDPKATVERLKSMKIKPSSTSSGAPFGIRGKE